MGRHSTSVAVREWRFGSEQHSKAQTKGDPGELLEGVPRGLWSEAIVQRTYRLGEVLTSTSRMIGSGNGQRLPLARLWVTHSNSQLSRVVAPPFDHAATWSASISEVL